MRVVNMTGIRVVEVQDWKQEGNNPGGNGTPNQFVVDFVAALAAANILNQPRVDAKSQVREITKDFRRMNPPSFDGSSTDPLVANHWLAEIRKLFNVLVINDDNMRVHLVACQLSGEANEWWESILAARRDARRVARAAENVKAPDIENLTWAEFEKMLKVFTEIVELARTLELPRDNVRNARGNEGRQSMGSGAWHLAVREVKVGRDRGIPSNLLKSAEFFRHLFLPGLGDTRRDHRSLATNTGCLLWGWCFGHVARFCPQKVGARSESGSVQQPRSGQSLGQNQQRGTQSQPHYRQTTTGQGPQGDRGASSSAPNPTTQGRFLRSLRLHHHHRLLLLLRL
ncbi:hypothetical protein Acr_17g0008490 [Actinidia rufa]|uniref:Retrotransposon gag domain-containing protein n=1 Tax=Actinidia rufa TaxID=165716 RepID=A0A7J0G3C5_9ERIC|nr:hypothetical protein Acr_17g0008490 [Actinidia rufa]